ncbi:hypothetical protein INR77_09065 [Erythrobacter sp. SCSIO 43205]|uniref:hypothetical protein n=1 Tax=Erythrobacter sp. SCSIO 43205 TaxID=2779361 RepID=UPI001CA88A1A|nr:hypothetical protein [Erythrobacter sp. SCSIO 43205]UAB76997.1 hypothetical protein INR77_09065 [Erythrobacter sp. SCSIO 43205]
MTYDHRFDHRPQMCGTERFKHYGALLPMEEDRNRTISKMTVALAGLGLVALVVAVLMGVPA